MKTWYQILKSLQATDTQIDKNTEFLQVRCESAKNASNEIDRL